MSEKKIGTRYFRAGDVLATDAIKLQIRLMKFIGPALDKLPAVFAARAASDPKTGTPSEVSPEVREKADEAAIQAIAGIFEKADPDAVVELIEDILRLAKISYDGKGAWDEIVLDQEFSGANAKDMFPAVLFILQETLGDFFPGALASGSHAMKKGRA